MYFRFIDSLTRKLQHLIKEDRTFAPDHIYIYVLSKYHQKVILIKNSGDIDIIYYYKNSITILHDILEYKVFLNITIGKNHIHLIL